MWDKYSLYIFLLWFGLCRLVLRKDRVRRIACGVSGNPIWDFLSLCRSKGVEQTFAPPASAMPVCLCSKPLWVLSGKEREKLCRLHKSNSKSTSKDGSSPKCRLLLRPIAKVERAPAASTSLEDCPASLPQEEVRSAPVSAMNLPPPIHGEPKVPGNPSPSGEWLTLPLYILSCSVNWSLSFLWRLLLDNCVTENVGWSLREVLGRVKL